ncbi:MAG: ribonuclease HII [Blastocatellia bacterium]|nr:ribonuclease HII [Blastocatellia bacterium]MCS7157800.1 ribonuclease HII [Blastocatellia bacterium]
MKRRRPQTCTATLERELNRLGYRLIAGVDEVGRGAWAGPVVAAAVILDLDRLPEGLDDSKRLSPSRREQLFQAISNTARAIALGIVDAREIDRTNILHATKRAMRQAIEGLHPRPDFLLIDAVKLDDVGIPGRALIRGDQISVSIAAASIIAKVTRDRLMRAYDRLYPGYGFAQHVGYGTPAHRDALARLGPCPLHRLSFRGVRQLPLDVRSQPEKTRPP